MNVIWKRILKPAQLQDIEVPEGSELLTARDQIEQICIWFKCDPERRMEKRRIAMCGTGHEAPLPAVVISALAFCTAANLSSMCSSSPIPSVSARAENGWRYR